MATMLPIPQAFLDDAGLPVIGGKVYTYDSGTTNPRTSYSDLAATTPNSNPITLDAAGRASIFGTGFYTLKVYRSDGITLVRTFDGVGIGNIDVTNSIDPTQGSGGIPFNASLAYGAGSIGRWLKDLATSVGSTLIGFIQAGVGAVTRTLQDKLREIQVSIIDYGATANGTADDTAAATSAQTASAFVFVPDGKSVYTTSAVNYQQFYGRGTMRMGSQTINLPVSPKTGGLVCTYNPLTFGSYENAVGAAFTINTGNAQLKNNVQVNGTSGSGYATPVGQQRDHVALFFSSAPAASIVAGASSTYTATTMTASEIGSAAAGAILPGMIVDTKHGTPYSGTVQSRSGSTITVDSWWLNGGSPTAGTPANGTGATINPTTYSFGANGTVTTTTTGTDAASGLEIDVFAQNATGAAKSTAFDAVGLGTSTALAGYRARSNWTIGFYSQGSGIASGFVADSTAAGFEARDVSSNGFQSRVGGTVFWSVTSLGRLSGDFRNTVFNASGSYTIQPSDAVIVNVTGASVLTLPAASGLSGRTFTVNAASGCTVKNAGGTTIKTLVSGTSAVFSCDGSFWY